MQICSSCGQENPDGFRLCGMCGAALATAPAAAREERKVVTILFTDLVGSTAKAERLDPEDVRAILSPYYSRLRDEIERFGGTVEKFIGDAVMAVFGAPVAHEDDPERAVRAALAIRDAIGDDLQIRTAVNTGEALVALGARPAEGEGMVSGDVVNTAARLQGAAPVNGILVGETTYRATRDVIEYRAAEPVAAKGKTEPVVVWEVVGTRASYGSDVEQKLRTPLVGRLRERALLEDSLNRARSEQSVQLVTLVGVPGIGKSRLVAELFQIADEQAELINWRQGRSLPYGETASFWALGEIVKGHAGVLESDAAEDVETKLAAMIEMLRLEASERDWIARHARPLVGLEAELRPDRAEAFSAWRRLVEAAAEQRPLVLVFEDLHWADEALLDFVDHLAEWATTVPLLIVATARPELLDRRPAWGGGKRNAFTLSIAALSNDETAVLLATLLDSAVLAADVQQAVLRRAEGNPLYAEEYVRMLAEHPDGDLPLPETVQGVIAARIDALPESEKALLQRASVVGKVFWPDALDDADERVLHALERKEFIRRDRRSTIAGETQYAFLHALVRDVAYGQIPRPQRIERHRRAAAWIATLSPDRSEGRAELLAHHYREALALAAATATDAADLVEPAKRAFLEAAERAQALNAWAAGVELAREALALAGDDDGLRAQALLQIADGSARLDDFHVETALEARDVFLHLGNVEDAARADIVASWIGFWTGDTPAAVSHAQDAVELLRTQAPSPLQARATAQLARRIALVGDQERAIALAEQALELARQFDDDRTASDALNTRGIARTNLVDPRGIDDSRLSVALAEKANSPLDIVFGWNNLVNCLWRFGQLDEASECAQAHIRDARRYGLTSALVWAEAELPQGLALSGRFREALAHIDTLLGDALAGRPHYQIGTVTMIRALILTVRGRTEDALVDARLAYDQTRDRGDPQAFLPSAVTYGFALWAAGRPEEALAAVEQATNDKNVVGMPDFTSHAPLLLTELGRPEIYGNILAAVERRSKWHRAAAHVVVGDFGDAAEVYAEIGAHFLEAWSRLLAAEHGAADQAERAYAYFAAEEASLFTGRCAALLPASA